MLELMNKINTDYSNAEKDGNEKSKKKLESMKIEDIVDLNIGLPPTSVTKVDSNSAGKEKETWTEYDNRVFLELIDQSVSYYKAKGIKPDYYKIMRNCLVKFLFKHIMWCWVCTLCSECLSVFYSYWIQFIIKFIREPAAETEELEVEQKWRGARLVVVFGLA